MACRTYIINAATVKDVVKLPTDMSDDRITPSLDLAHDQLRRTLGRTLYDAIDAAIVADPTLTGSDYATLVEEHLKYYVAWWTKWHAMPSLATFVSVSGVQQKSGADFRSADAATVASLKKQAKDAWEMYFRAMMDYLRDDDTPATVRDKFETTTDLDDRNNAEDDGGIILGNGPLTRGRPFERYDDDRELNRRGYDEPY